MCVPKRNHIKRWMAALLCLFLLLSDFVTANASDDVSGPPVEKRVRAGVFYFDGYHMKDENAHELKEALRDGSIDAILSSNLRTLEDERTLDTLMMENFYAIVRKDDTELLNEVNYAIEQMNINGGDWKNSLFFKYYEPVNSSGLTFNEREKAYIQDVIDGKKKITATAIGGGIPGGFLCGQEDTAGGGQRDQSGDRAGNSGEHGIYSGYRERRDGSRGADQK